MTIATKTKLIKNMYKSYASFAEKYLSSILLLAIRVFIGLVFYESGDTKIATLDQTIWLFANEYDLPFISPQLAAISSIIVELGCGALIIAGFWSRITVIPLIVMTLVIQFLVFENQDHFYWLFLLSTIAIYGGGALSVDGIYKKICKKK